MVETGLWVSGRKFPSQVMSPAMNLQPSAAAISSKINVPTADLQLQIRFVHVAYLVTISVATFGWLYFIAWCALQLI
jgi:hypothetical protein